jgi:acyl carrier protein
MLQTHQGHDIVKSFIATILDEESMKFVQEVEDVRSQYEHEVHGLDSVDSFNVALDHVIQAINIIKKDEHN